MKKIILAILMLFMTGCSMLSNNLDTLVKQSIKINHRPNYVTKGYKLYIPVNYNVINDYNNNLLILGDNQKIYLYSDLISYYYKYQDEYKYDVNNRVYYSKKLDYDDKLGYIEVRKVDNDYYVQILYNYAKVETVVNKNKLNDTIANSLTMLKSIIYKQKIIGVMLNKNEIGNDKEEVFTLFKPKNNTSEFLQYVENYDKYEGEIKVEEDPIVDRDQIDIDNTTEAETE